MKQDRRNFSRTNDRAARALPLTWLAALLLFAGIFGAAAELSAASLAAGASSTYLIKADGTLWAWGLNSDGQLGDTTTIDRAAPVQIGSATNWTSVASGRRHALAVRADGTLWAWGYNGDGEVGDGTNVDRFEPVRIGVETNWVSVAAGAYHSVAIRGDGTLWTWGSNLYGQLGDSTTVDRSVPTRIGTLTNWVSVAAGAHHVVGITSDGKLWAWGWNRFGQVGDSSVLDRLAPKQIGSATNWVGVAAGSLHSVAVSADGKLWTWGNNSAGQLCDGKLVDKGAPASVGAVTNWLSVSAGHLHTVAVRREGTLWACGWNYHGQLADGTRLNRNVPTQVQTETDWVSAAAGFAHTVAVKSNGAVWSSGQNWYGQLGDGTTSKRVEPARIGTLTTWTSAAAGGSHSVARKVDGTLWAWGYNAFGQLGDGSTNTSITPVQIGTATNWSRIAAGRNHSAAVRSDGTLWAWGRNQSGQIGDGTLGDRSAPLQIGDATDWDNVAAGDYHTLAIRRDGTLWAWGSNTSGQLGDATNVDRANPVRIGSHTSWVAIAAGSSHSLALARDGSLWAWGLNDRGQLGDGTDLLSRNEPGRVGTSTGWQLVAAGGDSTMAVMTDKTLWAWGSDYFGQLGDGLPAAHRNVPSQVGIDANWLGVNVGEYHAIAVRGDGTIWSWGRNAAGQVGDGTYNDRATPIQIGPPRNWSFVTAGASHTMGIHDGQLWSWGSNDEGQLGISVDTTVFRQIPVNRNAPNAQLSVQTLREFTPTGLGLTALQDVTLTATGTRAVGIRQISATPPFSVVPPCPPTLNPGESCRFTLRFSPVTVGTSSGVLTIDAYDLGTPTIKATVSGDPLALAGYGLPAVSSCSVETRAATNLTETSATIQGLVSSNGTRIVQIAFGYGTSMSLGSIAAASPGALPETAQGITVSAQLANLTCKTAYQFRVFATDALGNNCNGALLSFVTADCPRTSQTIVFGPAPTIVVGQTGTVVATGGGSGNSVGFATASPSVCTVSGNQVTGVSAGTCIVAATQIGNGSFADAPEVTQRFVVGPPLDALIVNPAALDFGGQSMRTTSPLQAVTVINTGGTSLTILSLAATPPFTLVSTLGCGTLQPGVSCSPLVTFTPTSSGTATGTLTVNTNVGVRALSLTGYGEYSLVTHFYQSILRRVPDSGGKTYWSGIATALPTWGASINETWYAMAMSFYSSPEYGGLGRDNPSFVTDLYRTFFNRDPDAGGLFYWTDVLARGVPREVALASFMFSREFAEFTQAIFGNPSVRADVNIVMDFYRGLLGRLPDRGGFDYWLAQIRSACPSGSAAINSVIDSISKQFLSGSEYVGRGRSNGQFVGDLYNSFLRRGGDEAGVTFWVNELNLGKLTREQERQAFLVSPEFTNRVNAVIAERCQP